MSDGKFLFHYTSLQGFLGIVEKSCLWASQLNFLNDYSEGQMFLEALEAEIENDKFFSKKLSLTDVKKIRDAVEKFCWLKIPRFSISFCEHNEADHIKNGILSQWRGYGEGGVALVFDKAKLIDACKKIQEETSWEHVLKPVVYVRSVEDIAKKIKPLNFQLTDMLEFVDAIIEKNSDIALSDKQKFKPMIDALVNVAPFIKHSGFEEEREYRLLIAPDYFEGKQQIDEGLNTGNWKRSGLGIHYRFSGGKILPYLEALSFTSDEVFLKDHPIPQGLLSCLTKVIVGPSKTSGYNFLATKALLSARNIEVDFSDIRYQ